MTKPLSLILLAALTACGASENDPGVGGVTAGEAQALNDAAAMLDEQANNVAVALPPPTEANSAGSNSSQ